MLLPVTFFDVRWLWIILRDGSLLYIPYSRWSHVPQQSAGDSKQKTNILTLESIVKSSRRKSSSTKLAHSSLYFGTSSSSIFSYWSLAPSSFFDLNDRCQQIFP